MEQFADKSAADLWLRTVQAISEKSFIWDLRNHSAV